MAEIAALTPTSQGRDLREDRKARQRAVAVQTTTPREIGTPHHARGHSSCAARAASSSPSTWPTDEKVTRKYPAAADHRAHPVAVQRRRADAAARPTTCGMTRTGWKSTRMDAQERGIKGRATGPASKAGPATPCCAPSSASACSPAWSQHHLPLPRVGRQRHHHRQLRLGHQLPRVHKGVTAVQVLPVDAAVRVAAVLPALQPAAAGGRCRRRKTPRRRRRLSAAYVEREAGKRDNHA